MKAIYSRRSIRKYTSQDVSDDEILAMIKAGMNAPSAGNEQPWHFIIVRDRNVMREITKVHPHASMLTGAPCAVIVCCDMSLVRHEGFWIQDCAAATQNMLLAAADTGLGSVWLGVYPRMDRVDGIRRLFGLPQSVVPFVVLPVGYPAEKHPANDKFDRSRIHYNEW